MGDRMQQELAALPGLEQLVRARHRHAPVRYDVVMRCLVLIALFREQVSSASVAEELQIKSRDRKLERKADKLLDDISNNAQDEEDNQQCDAEANSEDSRDGPVESIRFPPLKPTRGPLPRRSDLKHKGPGFASTASAASKSTAFDWNFDTSIETPLEDDDSDNSGVRRSAEKTVQLAGGASPRAKSRRPGADITIERTPSSKQPSAFAAKFKKNQLQILQHENATLTHENTKLREEITQLEALNLVLQNDNCSSSNMLDDPSEAANVAQRRMRLLQTQNVQLQRQVSLLQDAVAARENVEASLLSALHHWHDVIDAGRQEAKAAGANQNATGGSESEAGKPMKWMLAVPEKLLGELQCVEQQIRGASIAANACFEMKLRVSGLSASFLRDPETTLKMLDIHGGGLSNLSHLKLERVKQLEDALARVAIELDQLSAQVLQRFPPQLRTVPIADPVHESTYELARRVRELLLELGAFGVVVATPSAIVPSSRSDAAEERNSGGITAIDIAKALSSTFGIARGAGGAKEREKHARLMLKQLHARHAAMENDVKACRREAGYWRTAWHTQDEILGVLAKRVRRLGQKKVVWCHDNLLTPMSGLTGVFASFQRAYDENTTRQNPYLPLLVETLSTEQPLVEEALRQWEDYSLDIQAQLDGLVADYEANRLVLASSASASVPNRQSRPATPYSECDEGTLPSVSENVPMQ
ncbi:hypothetical protein BBJ28_00002530 [Nothophytophthora sp. Chile5]|nr:hypothetical protein BBJ28_00002530 [Nothophytophthora sp. Chile5]